MGVGEGANEEYWQRMKRGMMNLKSECLRRKDVDGLSSFTVRVCACVFVRGRGGRLTPLCLHRRQRDPPSYSSMNMHVCVHEVLSQERPISPGKVIAPPIRLISSLPTWKMSYIKIYKCHSPGRLWILISVGILSDIRGEKTFKRRALMRNWRGIRAGEPFFSTVGRAADVINRFEVNNLLSGALAIWAVARGGVQGHKPGTLFSR